MEKTIEQQRAELRALAGKSVREFQNMLDGRDARIAELEAENDRLKRNDDLHGRLALQRNTRIKELEADKARPKYCSVCKVSIASWNLSSSE